jgi:hypothetical protein
MRPQVNEKLFFSEAIFYSAVVTPSCVRADVWQRGFFALFGDFAEDMSAPF